MKRNIKILGTGEYLPKRIVTSKEIDQKLGLSEGWTEKKSGVKTRHFVDNETASEMGAKAALQALKEANLTLEDIDCIVSTSGSMEQPIPCTASLIHEQLKPKKPIPAFDVNSTCLSFVTGFDMLSHLVHNGVYKNVLLISTEVASIAINPNQKESYVLFGDAAAACVISATQNGETSKILASKMETFSEGAHYTEVRGGGTKFHPREYSENTKEEFLFHMDGKEVFRLSSKKMNSFVDSLLEQSNLKMDDISLVIPHQASGMAMRILRQKLGISEEKFANIIAEHGNNIAASIPLTLHKYIQNGKLKRGDLAMFLGTSAGLSLGGVIFEY